MKLQHLAIIFVIIILPISLVVGEYIQTQINTIALQTTYSNKLQTATYDAISALRLNTINNKYSSVSDSKIRDINASISTFYTSLGREMGADGYGDNELQVHTPALLYTMYDGYYIYSKYYNESAGEYQYGLKPYIYYSCRYKNDRKGFDIVVNYTLDNYITIYGTINGDFITKSGSIINPSDIDAETQYKISKNMEIKNLKYCRVTIEEEVVKEQIVYLDKDRQPHKDEYNYIVYDNNKVYFERIEENQENEKNQFFTINSEFKKQYIVDSEVRAELNKKVRLDDNGNYVLYNDSAVKYYVEAYKFSNWVKQTLSDVTQQDAVDENGNPITDFVVDENGNKTKTGFAVDTGSSSIFDYTEFNTYGDNSITDSTFDLNRISVIRRSIQTNLLTAIANYNHLSENTSYEFVLPVFSEEDWYKITNNISVVSFLQGIPIGTKYFNDYCVITNNKNKEVVTLDSLYAITEDGEVHLPNCKEILDNKLKVVKVYKNIDFLRQTVTISDGNERYYYPHYNTRCYNCLVNVAQTYDIDYLKENGTVKDYDYRTEAYVLKTNVDSSTLYTLRKEVLTALARERFDLYKVNDYFKGYDETESINSIEENNNRYIKFEYGWNSSTHYATAQLTKKENIVSNSFRIQYQVIHKENFRGDSNIDNSAWVDDGYNTNEVTVPYLKEGDVVLYRLFDGIYEFGKGHTTILDTSSPRSPRIKVIYGDTGKPVEALKNDMIRYYKSSYVTIRIYSGRDDESGINRIVYKLEGANTLSETTNLVSELSTEVCSYESKGKKIEYTDYYIDLNLYNDGKTTITLHSYDNAENREFASLDIYKDSTPPTEPTIEVIQGTLGENSYYTSNVNAKITFGKDDRGSNQSGIDLLHYVLNDGEERIVKVTDINGEYIEVPITNDGTTVIRAWMEDKAGNKSVVVEKTINKDTYKPVITANLSASDKTTRSFKLNISVRDVTSGIDKIIWYYYKKSDASTYTRIETLCDGETESITKSQPIENLTSGVYKTYAEVYDKAGNMIQTGILDVATYNLEKGPILIASPEGWTNQNVTVSTSVATNNYTLQYQIGSYTGTWNNYDGSIPEITENTIVYSRYTDGINAGGYETTSISNIDKEAPSKTTVNLNGYTSGTWTTGNVVQSFNATDNVGIAKWQYSHDGINVAGEVSNPWEINWNGEWNFYVRAVDYAGNEGQWSDMYTIRRNNTDYTITLNLDGGNASWTSTTYNISSNDITLPTPTRSGYTFKGWTGSNGGTPQINVTISKGSTGNRSYTANWEVENYYLVQDNIVKVDYGYKIEDYASVSENKNTLWASEWEDDGNTGDSSVLVWWSLPEGFTKATIEFTLSGDAGGESPVLRFGVSKNPNNIHVTHAFYEEGWESSVYGDYRKNDSLPLPRSVTLPVSFSTSSSRYLVVHFTARTYYKAYLTMNNVYLHN